MVISSLGWTSGSLHSVPAARCEVMPSADRHPAMRACSQDCGAPTRWQQSGAGARGGKNPTDGRGNFHTSEKQRAGEDPGPPKSSSYFFAPAMSQKEVAA